MKQLLSFIFLIPVFTYAQLNGALVLSGRVVGENHEGIASASITVKGLSVGTMTDSSGNFSLVISQKLPFKIIISSVGFAPAELEVNNTSSKLSVQLQTQNYIAN